MGLHDWFLMPSERGNDATAIDHERADGIAWTEGNRVGVLIDGAFYFARLADALGALGPGGAVQVTGWQGDADERLTEHGPTVGALLEALARRSVDVRGLFWRSH